MNSLESALSGIPFLSGYEAQKNLNQKRGLAEMEQAKDLMGILAVMQGHQQRQRDFARQDQFRSELASAKTPEEQIAIAQKYGDPKDLMQYAQGSLDRKALREQQAQQYMMRLMDAQEARQQKHTEFQQRQADANARAAEMLQFRKDMLAFQQQQAGAMNFFKQQGLDIQKMVAEQGKRPLQTTDVQGNVRLYDNSGGLVADLGRVGTPSATNQKVEAEKVKTLKGIDEAIVELGKAVKDGGLIDKSTGSGAGSMVDKAAGFFGAATPGAVAAGELAPIFDIVLKMVPRFEGPQSDKDTQSYKEAAGQLANPAVPNKIKKEAGKTILRLMQQRRGQFTNRDAPAEAAPDPLGIR